MHAADAAAVGATVDRAASEKQELCEVDAAIYKLLKLPQMESREAIGAPAQAPSRPHLSPSKTHTVGNTATAATVGTPACGKRTP